MPFKSPKVDPDSRAIYGAHTIGQSNGCRMPQQLAQTVQCDLQRLRRGIALLVRPKSIDQSALRDTVATEGDQGMTNRSFLIGAAIQAPRLRPLCWRGFCA